jgi:hypothetical protein
MLIIQVFLKGSLGHIHIKKKKKKKKKKKVIGGLQLEEA